jgi:hypothetical protein
MADTTGQGRTKFAEFLWEASWQSEAYPDLKSESPKLLFQKRICSTLPPKFGKPPGKMAKTTGQGRKGVTLLFNIQAAVALHDPVDSSEYPLDTVVDAKGPLPFI